MTRPSTLRHEWEAGKAKAPGLPGWAAGGEAEHHHLFGPWLLALHTMDPASMHGLYHARSSVHGE